MSNEHLLYLKNIKRKKHKILLSQILLLTTFIIIWELFEKYNIINSFITSCPSNIIKTIIELYNQNNLFIHIITTINEVLLSFFITSTLSFIIAIFLYSNETIEKIVDPYITILNS